MTPDRRPLLAGSLMRCPTRIDPGTPDEAGMPLLDPPEPRTFDPATTTATSTTGGSP